MAERSNNEINGPGKLKTKVARILGAEYVGSNKQGLWEDGGLRLKIEYGFGHSEGKLPTGEIELGRRQTEELYGEFNADIPLDLEGRYVRISLDESDPENPRIVNVDYHPKCSPDKGYVRAMEQIDREHEKPYTFPIERFGWLEEFAQEVENLNFGMILKREKRKSKVQLE